MSTTHIPPAEIAAGTKDEHAEHHMPLPIAKRTALDHLREFPHYYSDLAKAEPKFRKTALFACYPDGSIVHHACGDDHVAPATTKITSIADLGRGIGHDKAFREATQPRALLAEPPLPAGARVISWQDAHAALRQGMTETASGIHHVPQQMPSGVHMALQPKHAFYATEALQSRANRSK